MQRQTVYVLFQLWILVCLLSGCASQQPQRYEFTRLQMGVQARIVIFADPTQRYAATTAAAAAFEEMARLEQIFSDYRPHSELMQLSAKAGCGPVAVSDELLEVLSIATAISRDSDGGFDVTAGPLTKLWRTSRDQQRLPTEAELSMARKSVGWQHMSVDAQSRTVELQLPNISLDLGGIAKGYAAERALHVLKLREFDRALVALAGDIAMGNPPPDTSGWVIEVNGGNNRATERLTLQNVCVSTSGDAEQFVEIDEIRYSHIIDPRTGLGSTHPISATVVASSGAIADALASALCVMSNENQIVVLMNKYPDTAAIVALNADGSSYRIVIDPSRLLR